jgi:hypothetical protein
MNSFQQGKTGIVTTDEFFKAADGDNYKAIAGPIYYTEAKEVMGFVPKNSANWAVVVGDIGRVSHKQQQIVAGCQVHYVHIAPPEQIRDGGQNLLDLRL